MKGQHKIKDAELNKLYLAILKLKNINECKRFFRDLCTIEELSEMSKRWQTVRLLAKKQPYRDIAEKTGLSTTTVTRIAHWLNYGKGGYQLALKRLKLL